MPGPLVVSIVASVVLTVVLNLVLWLFPGVSRRLQERVGRMIEAGEHAEHEPPASGSKVRVIVPWKLMLIGSLVLTVLLNLVLLLRR